MRVLIVSKTHMSNSACVGAIDMKSHKSVRLLNAEGFGQPVDTPFSIGSIWDIDCVPRPNLVLPHVEDVLVRSQVYVSDTEDLVAYVHSSGIPIWRGGLESLFDGKIQSTSSGGSYVATPNMSNQSVGFWIADRDLIRNDFKEKVRYCYRPITGTYAGQKCSPYVGYDTPLEVIPAGTLIRVSLARPYAREQGETPKCWLQISGWYGIEAPEVPATDLDEEYDFF